MNADQAKLINILLVEDNPADIRLTMEALHECKLVNAMEVITDGQDAIDYLLREGKFSEAVRPDLVLLDLNLPRRSGQEVLAEMKADESLKFIPVVVMTGSSAERDIVESYGLNCNCYVVKPLELDEFLTVVKAIENFWLSIVQLPPTR